MGNLEKIYDNTKKVVSEIENGILWLQSNGDKATKNSKIKKLKESKRHFNRIAYAATKRPSVAIFGQSQVGKSFLVRSLAKSPITSKLEIINSRTKQRIDFLQKINPPGGRESTGIITRFSTSTPEIVNENYPYKLELLTQLDIASIIINGYLEDLQDYVEELDKEEIINTINSLKSNVNDFDTGGVSEDEVYDFNDFVVTNYRDDYRIKFCEEIDYFSDLVYLLPKIPYDKRWKLLYFLWGKNAFLTEVFQRLSQTLFELKFSKTAYVDDHAIINYKKDPLFSDTTNILDVERVKEMFQNPSLEKLEVCNEEGTLRKIAVSELCSLVKELHFEIPNDYNNQEIKLLTHTDILDFPGSKSREKIPENVFNSNGDKAKLSVFVRGKVAYLFYLYNRDIGISTLLYCMDNEPPLVSESPSLLNKWIKRYIGETPEKRKEHQQRVLELLKSESVSLQVNKLSPLLVAMTKFNVELAGKGGAEVLGDVESHNSKWNARFKENFSNYMIKPVDNKWTENWTENGESFKFIFPIRDPGFSGSFFEGYEPTRQTEIRVRPEKESVLDDMKKSFLSSKIVDDFIFEKSQVWNELLTPNKTGIDYLCKYLEPSSNPINMLAQLEMIYNEWLNKSLDVLLSEYSTGDMNQELKEAKIRGAKAFTSILSLSNNTQTPLSNYLKQMITTENEIWRLLYNFTFNPKEENNEIDYENVKIFLSNLGINFDNVSEERLKQELTDFFGVDEDNLNEILQDQLGASIEDLFQSENSNNNSSDIFADLVLNHWGDKISSIALNSGNYSETNKEIFNDIFSEILKSNTKEEIKKEIISIIDKEMKEGGITKIKFNLISSSIASILNRYMFSASWMYKQEDKKPHLKSSNKRIFSKKSILGDKSIVTKEALESKTKNYISEFSMGVKELFTENVNNKYGLGNDFNSEINEKLGEIIHNLKEI